jgi:hypothetical protein
MREFFEAAIVLTLSIAITAGIMAILMPKHARGGGHDADDSPQLQPAVFVHGSHDSPGASASPMTPNRADQAPREGCPFLEVLTATPGCPATVGSSTTISCPYLMQIHSQFVVAEEQTETSLGQSI